jgi:glutamate carboxypeptidase
MPRNGRSEPSPVAACATANAITSWSVTLPRGPGRGIESGEGSTGGVSDGCWAAAGIPTLDGLGPVGDHDHAADEFIEVDSIPTRCGISPGRSASRGRRLREKLSHRWLRTGS